MIAHVTGGEDNVGAWVTHFHVLVLLSGAPITTAVAI
jgi:hypothetical protein